MADQVQCDNCGAVLLTEDLFCGECGASRPSLAEVSDSAAVQQPVTPPKPPSHARPTPKPASPSRSSETAWRATFVVLVVLGILVCIAALVAFFVFGMAGEADVSETENWLFSALFCLLPIGGLGAVLLAIGTVIWYTALRKR